MPEEIQTRSVAAKAEVTATAGAYAAGNIMGGLLTLKPEGGDYALHLTGTGVICNVTVADYTGAGALLDVIFFHKLPAATFTDKAALALTTADLKLVAGVVSILAADYVAAGTGKVATKQPLAIEVCNNSGDGKLYALLIARGALTPGAVPALQVAAGLLQD